MSKDLTSSEARGRVLYPLPDEVTSHLLQYADPISIFRMRMTCKATERVTYDRRLWTSILDGICDDLGIFKPTFPLDKMTIRELEHAATAPRRFMDALELYGYASRLGPGEVITPFQNRQHFQRLGPFSPHIDTHESYATHNFWLVPGGRFLVASWAEELILWDLGYCSTQYLRPFPLTVGEHFGDAIAVRPTSDGKELIVATILRDKFMIYRVNPTAPRVEFVLVAVLPAVGEDLGSTRVIDLTDSLAILWEYGQIVVWNWIEGTACRWETPLTQGLDYADGRLMVWATEEYIIVTTIRGTIYVWDIPTTGLEPVLDETDDIDDLHSVINNPRSMRVYNTGDHVNSMAGTNPWVHPSQRRGNYFCLVTERGRETFVHLFAVRQLQRQQAADPRSSCPVTRIGYFRSIHASRTAQFLNFSPTMSPLFRLGNSLVFCTTTVAKQTVTTILPLPERPDQAHESNVPIERGYAGLTSPQVEWIGGDREDMSNTRSGFCPMSARLVHLVSKEHLYISEYLLPPFEH